MAESAKITSIEVLSRLAATLRSFEEESSVALDELNRQARRAVEWIQHDQREYWRLQLRKRWDGVSAARANLARARATKVADHQPACREERKALEKAKRRLQIAQEKVEVVRRWSNTIVHELNEYKGGTSRFASWLQGDLPKAVATLSRMSDSLDSYVSVKSTSTPAAPQASSDESTGGEAESRPEQNK